MASPEQPLAPEKPPAKPLTLQEISELRKKAMEQAGNSAMSGTDWANIALLIVAEQLAIGHKPMKGWHDVFGVEEAPAP